MYQLRRLFENTERTPTTALPAKRKVAPAAASASKRQKQQTADESDEQASSTAPAEAPPAKKQKKKPQKEDKRKKQLPIEQSDPQEDEMVGVWLTPAAPTKQPAQVLLVICLPCIGLPSLVSRFALIASLICGFVAFLP